MKTSDLLGEWLQLTGELARRGGGGLADVALRMRDGSGVRRDDASPGAREREARHELHGAILSGMADALEARHRASELESELDEHAKRRSEKGFEGEDDPIAYDMAAFGAHTLKTFLELNARANRKVLDALRGAAQGRDATVGRAYDEPVEQQLEPIRLLVRNRDRWQKPWSDIAARGWEEELIEVGSFEVWNRRGAFLAFGIPDTWKIGSHKPFQVRLTPPSVHLEPGGRLRVRVELPKGTANALTRGEYGPLPLSLEIVPADQQHGRVSVLRVEFAPKPWAVRDARHLSELLGLEFEKAGNSGLETPAGGAISVEEFLHEMSSAVRPTSWILRSTTKNLEFESTFAPDGWDR